MGSGKTPVIHYLTHSKRLVAMLEWAAPRLDFTLKRYRHTEALQETERTTGGCTLLDLGLGWGHGMIALIENLTAAPTAQPLVAHLHHVTVPLAIRTMKAGAFDIICAPLNGPALQTALLDALEEAARTAPLRRRAAQLQHRLEQLSRRERQVLQWVLAGQMNKQIAYALGISCNTVEVHRSHALRKLGVASAMELAESLLQYGVGGELFVPRATLPTRLTEEGGRAPAAPIEESRLDAH